MAQLNIPNLEESLWLGRQIVCKRSLHLWYLFVPWIQAGRCSPPSSPCGWRGWGSAWLRWWGPRRGWSGPPARAAAAAAVAAPSPGTVTGWSADTQCRLPGKPFTSQHQTPLALPPSPSAILILLCISCCSNLVQDLCGEGGKARTEVVAVEAQDGEERAGGRHSVDGDRQHAVWPGQAAARHDWGQPQVLVPQVKPTALNPGHWRRPSHGINLLPEAHRGLWSAPPSRSAHPLLPCCGGWAVVLLGQQRGPAWLPPQPTQAAERLTITHHPLPI